MWRALASNALTLVAVALFLLGGLILWGRGEYTRAGPLEQAICFRVEGGARPGEVARALAARGAVTNARLFVLGLDYTGRDSALKAGNFRLPAEASMAAIAELLSGDGRSTCGAEAALRIGVTASEIELREIEPVGNRYVTLARFDAGGDPPAAYLDRRDDPELRFRVVLAEGVTSARAVAALMAADFLTGTVEAPPPEGSLAPQSYQVARSMDRAALIARMQAVQEAILAELWPERAEELPFDTPEDALILASIVEKETAVAEERPLVASVFVNRLTAGMRLQSDPTVIYAITRGERTLERGLRQSELRRDTSWNTYVNAGLPPTPIANPGREAIAAVLNPAETEYLYFVADGSGGHAFAKTLAEHNRNVARWREIEAQGGE